MRLKTLGTAIKLPPTRFSGGYTEKQKAELTAAEALAALGLSSLAEGKDPLKLLTILDLPRDKSPLFTLSHGERGGSYYEKNDLYKFVEVRLVSLIADAAVPLETIQQMDTMFKAGKPDNYDVAPTVFQAMNMRLGRMTRLYY